MTAVLAAHGITFSMSRRGKAHDNAAIESWFSTMTFELSDRIETHRSAKAELFDYTGLFYNQERSHSTLGYVSPAQFERAARMEQAAPQSTCPPNRVKLTPYLPLIWCSPKRNQLRSSERVDGPATSGGRVPILPRIFTPTVPSIVDKR